MEREFEIWAEGYAATGESGIAQKIGVSKGKSFNDAVKNFKDKHPGYEIERDNRGRWYI